jgi:hypothetical protein
MSGDGRPKLEVPQAKGLRVGVVATSWHGEITDSLLERAVALATLAEASTPTVVRVPGAIELPIVAQALATSHDAVVALGVSGSIGWSVDKGISLSLGRAEARVGRPLTPVSVASVARRTTRRAVVGGAAVGAAAVGTACVRVLVNGSYVCRL